jgi:tetratricopeptide (TPR) repeat protein
MGSRRSISLARRFTIALVSVVLCAVLFRGQVATALVSRGDEFLLRGRVERALRYYDRAMTIDARSAVAADRIAFAGILLRTPAALAAAIRATSLGLAVHPMNADLLVDRALCSQLEQRHADAYRDFLRAAALKRDPRLYHFAAWNAFRAGDIASARRAWRDALDADGSFFPARAALARTGLGR